MVPVHLEFDHRFVFYFDPSGEPHLLPAHRFDHLMRGEPDATMPEFADRRIRFAVLHVERLTWPPKVVLDYYPMAHFDADGHVDEFLHWQQLQAEVDQLEAHDYAPDRIPGFTVAESSTSWQPDPFTRRKLLAAIADRRRGIGYGLPPAHEPAA